MPPLLPRSLCLGLRLCVGVLLAFVFAGCGKVPLFSELSENEANEMMAILLQRDIVCTKLAGKDEKWSLKVGQADFSRAVDLLKAQGYPRDKFVRIGDVFQKSGLVSSPTEERIRYMYALSQEIAETFMRIDGVMNARVHIVIPDNDPLAAKITPSSAAIFIRYRPGFDIESLSPQLKSLVMRSIEGLNYDNVSLVLVPAAAAPGPVSTLKAASSPVPQDWLLLAALVTAAAAAGAGLLWLVQKQGARKDTRIVPA
ncbi:type III secretion system inner membrane ring lipoprotein SctJ [Horticoccus sp. 23ND18S-11]|uniref:type III secretion system inner membrane ring lipoprotein SctJ n=1 Tax=Horticoccus sp. 23ND18S-11 TaxID=3391832 RepID=UPI0039C9ED91